MAVKFNWAKYRSKHPKLPDVKEQWRRIINAERGVIREAINANKVEQARIQGQKEGLRIIGEEVAPFARYVIRNPKGDLVGIVNDQEQLKEQLENLNITPNAFDPKGFNAQGKQVIGKYRIYDNAIRGEERRILEIAHPKAVPLHKRINVPLLINERMQDVEIETRASSVPTPRDDEIELLDEEIKEKEAESMEPEEKGGKEEIKEGGKKKKIKEGTWNYKGITVKMESGKDRYGGVILKGKTQTKELGDVEVTYRKGRASGEYAVKTNAVGDWRYGASFQDAMDKILFANEAIQKEKHAKGEK